MANVCMVTYICEGKEEQLIELHEVLLCLQNSRIPVVQNDWGNLWLGCVINQLGGDWHAYRCRGVIVDFGLHGDGVLYIEQVTAWCEQEEFRCFLQQCFPKLKIYHRQVESALNNIYTNDVEGKYFPEHFFLGTHNGLFYFVTIEEVSVFVSDILGYKVIPDFWSIYDALDEYTDKYLEEDEAFYIFSKITISV